MDGSQHFRLKWNNYHVNIASSFDLLRLDEDFVDVTVACDGFQTKAHRMVLSACSTYFRELLKSHRHPHPIVVLRGVVGGHLRLLLDYMYRGEVKVAQAQLADFLSLAEMLQVKGLAVDRPPPPATDDSSALDRPPPPAAQHTSAEVGPEIRPPCSPGCDLAPTEKRRRALSPAGRSAWPGSSPEPEQQQELEPDIEPEQEPEPEPEPADGLTERLRGDLTSSPPTDLSTGRLEGPGPSAVAGVCDPGPEPPLAPDPAGRPAAPRRASCPICGRWFQKGSHLREHVASIHYPVPSRCELCGKLLRSKASLRTHLIKYHRRAEPRPPGKLARRGPLPAVSDGCV